MTCRILIAPAGAGKTAFAVAEARRQAHDLAAPTFALVAGALQAQAFRRRLARAGGAIGVRVLTFEELYQLCLSDAGIVYTKISEMVGQRVVHSVLRDLPLAHYGPIRNQPGLARVMKRVIDELKAGAIDEDVFQAAVQKCGGVPRLRDVADVYAGYQAVLDRSRWADTAGLGRLAAECLRDRTTGAGRNWSLLAVDGFDDFSPIQLDVLASLVERVDRVVITLTGEAGSAHRSLAHRRFERTRRELADRLGVTPAPLPEAKATRAPALDHVETRLFRARANRLAGDEAVERIEATNQAEEVRAALRWAKREIVANGTSPSEIALLARDVAPYRPFITQIASEFGLPVRLYTGYPLSENPVVAALLDLLRLMLPVTRNRGARSTAGGKGGEEPSLPPRLVVEAWRSPYFDWTAGALAADTTDGVPPPLQEIRSGDADTLGAIARRGRVITGLSQWEEAFEALKSAGGEDEAAEGDVSEARDVAGALKGPQVRRVREIFGRFVERLRPPQGHHSRRIFVQWLESLIGPDSEVVGQRDRAARSRTSLTVVACTRSGKRGASEAANVPSSGRRIADSPVPSDRDLAALHGFKKVLRGLIWAEDVLREPPVSYPAFVEDLSRALEGAVYHIPSRPGIEEILVADPVAARGVAFHAVAVLGMAEGFFPASKNEDPILWDADRSGLELNLRPSTESAEAEYFYESAAAASRKLLLTRPRLTSEGAVWPASPFWEEIGRLVEADPTVPSDRCAGAPQQAASWPELILASVDEPHPAPVGEWLRQRCPEIMAGLDRATKIVAARRKQADSPFDGNLRTEANHFATALGRGYIWSASRLESYRACPFSFFVSKILELEPREEPSEGIDWVHRGNLYHKMLERVYRAAEDPTDLEGLIEALPRVSDPVLDAAPKEQGFRRTAWWTQTRQELVEHVRDSLRALHEEELMGGFVPFRHEAAFGLRGAPSLLVEDAAEGDAFMLRGFIDRVDRDSANQLRVIDYKTGGPSSYRDAALREGEKIQLPLYALAARDALALGEPVSGFYWHVRHAEPSPFKLEKFGLDEAIRTAVAYAWKAIRSARAGSFPPLPPRTGCPPYCPAVGFCWQYERRYGG